MAIYPFIDKDHSPHEMNAWLNRYIPNDPAVANQPASSSRHMLREIFTYVGNPRMGGHQDDWATWFMEGNPYNFNWPNRKDNEKETKSPNQLVLKSTQGAIFDIKEKYKRSHKYSRIKENHKSNYISIEFDLPVRYSGTTQSRPRVFGTDSKGNPHKQVVKFEATGKVITAGGAKVSDATMTKMQEMGSLAVFKKAIRKGVSFKSAKDIKDDDTLYAELKKIWKDVGDVDEIGFDWIDNFYKQNIALFKGISNPDFTEFDHSATGGFMDFVKKKVNTYFDITKKDNWNPADIWLMKGEAQARSEIERMFGNKQFSIGMERDMKLEQFNDYFRQLFKNKNGPSIVGISLKKVSKDVAVWEEVNVDKDDFLPYLKERQYQFDSATCKLGLKTLDSGVVTLSSQDMRLDVKDTNPKTKATYSFQIKANNSSEFSGLKFEPTDKAKGAARLGKATVEHVVDLVRGSPYNFKFSKENSTYPQDPDSFEKKENDWKKKLQIIINDKDTETEIETVQQAYDNLLFTFSSQPHVANSKLMQIEFLYQVLSLNHEQRSKLLRDMLYIAMKAGHRYGPFGKIS